MPLGQEIQQKSRLDMGNMTARSRV